MAYEVDVVLEELQHRLIVLLEHALYTSFEQVVDNAEERRVAIRVGDCRRRCRCRRPFLVDHLQLVDCMTLTREPLIPHLFTCETNNQPRLVAIELRAAELERLVVLPVIVKPEQWKLIALHKRLLVGFCVEMRVDLLSETECSIARNVSVYNGSDFYTLSHTQTHLSVDAPLAQRRVKTPFVFSRLSS